MVPRDGRADNGGTVSVGSSQDVDGARGVYAKVILILSEVHEVPQAFVHAFDAEKCMVQAGNSECWILTVREIEEEPT
ncbi:MAG: hypothetical protein IPJ34_34435 [Myxococcales bacterium]|nr:hypothetical protein [Myxococcales bacterium]